ncbi:MAG: hypothetical protein ACOCYT_00915 [Chloroflexota bacterium]
MDITDLEIENARAHYNPEDQIVYITYQGALDGSVTIKVYDWLDQLYQLVGLEAIYGEIFDFRKVDHFDQSNLVTARRTSNRMNMSKDTSQFPVALIVGSHDQEEILRGPMRIPEGHQRKRIVWSQDEGLEFIHDWNRSKQRD